MRRLLEQKKTVIKWMDLLIITATEEYLQKYDN